MSIAHGLKIHWVIIYSTLSTHQMPSGSGIAYCDAWAHGLHGGDRLLWCMGTWTSWTSKWRSKLLFRPFAFLIWRFFGLKFGKNCSNRSFQLLELHNWGAPRTIEGVVSFSAIKIEISAMKTVISARKHLIRIRRNSSKKVQIV